MNNFRRWNFLLRMLSSIATGVVLLLAACSYVLADDGKSWGSMPVEVRAIPLRQLLERGDYKSFLETYRASKGMQAVVDSDPVLKGTYQGLQDKELQRLIEGLPQKGKDLRAMKSDDIRPIADDMQSIMNKIVAISNAASASPEIRSQIETNLGYVLFAQLRKVIDGYLYRSDMDSSAVRNGSIVAGYLFRAIGKSIPKEYLPVFDKLLSHSANEVTIIPGTQELRYLAILWGLRGLAVNKNIPTGEVLDRVNHYKDILPNVGVTGTAVTQVINGALRSLAKRPDMDDKTIQYFRAHESDASWQQDSDLEQALRYFKENPASHKGL